jgi:hypothetical protein
LSRTARRLWLLALVLYGAGASADTVVHLAADVDAGQNWWAPDNLAVAVSAGLFWPVDLIARYLLSR